MSNNLKYYNLHIRKKEYGIEKINSNLPLHNIGGCLKISEVVNIKVIREAINIIIKNNDGFRLRFTEYENERVSILKILNNWTKNNEIIVELEKHGRESIDDYIDVLRTVGWFTGMYPAYFSIEHDDMENNIKSLKEQFRYT